MAGLKAYVREGLENPESIKQSIAEYKDEMDIIGQFIKENVKVHEGHKVKASVVYQAYKQWATENGHYVFSGTKFGIEFTKRFKKTMMKGYKFYQDLSLVES